MDITALIRRDENLTAYEMSARAIIAFFITIILIRLGGVRIFGRRSTIDTIIMIIMGSVLARGIVGASSLLSVIAASAAMIIIHRLLSWLSYKYKKVEWLVKGGNTILYNNGIIFYQNLARASLSERDLYESLRLETKQESLDDIETAYLETNGRISFIKKENIPV